MGLEGLAVVGAGGFEAFELVELGLEISDFLLQLADLLQQVLIMLPEILSFFHPGGSHFAKPLGGVFFIHIIEDCIGEPIKLIR